MMWKKFKGLSSQIYFYAIKIGRKQKRVDHPPLLPHQTEYEDPRLSLT